MLLFGCSLVIDISGEGERCCSILFSSFLEVLSYWNFVRKDLKLGRYGGENLGEYDQKIVMFKNCF